MVLFYSQRSEIKESQKQHVRKEIAIVNGVGVDSSSPADIKIFNLHICDAYLFRLRLYKIYIRDNYIVALTVI